MGMTILGRHVYQEESQDNGGGGGPPAVQPADARKFITDFVDDPKTIEAWDDKKVIDFHGRLNAAVDKVRPKGGTWPEKWRDEFAAGNADVMKRFERYQSPKDVAQALIAAQNKIASGQLKEQVAFPEKGTDLEKAAWYKEQGLPATPADYKLKLKDGLVIGEEDKPIVEAFLKVAHANRMNDAQTSGFVSWYYDEIERQATARDANDKAIAVKTSDQLHAEWGKEYRSNMNLYTSFLDSLPAGVKEKFTRGRLEDGTAIGSSPEFVQWVVSKARELNPAGIVIPAGEGGVTAAVDDEIKAIEKNMGAPRGTPEHKAYWDDEKAQLRLRDLYRARERAQGQQQR